MFKYFELNKNENKTYPNLWGTTKGVVRGKLIVLNSYVKNEETSQISNLGFYLEKL